jgi:hypothetical protein
MEVSVKYGCITMTPAPKIAVPLSAAIDDMLGLSVESSYLAHLAASYPGLWAHEDAQTRMRLVRRDVAAWIETGLSVDFEFAVRTAEQGHLSDRLAPYVARIGRRPGPAPDEVNDLPTLATWALDALTRRRHLRLGRCRVCGLLWIPPENGRDVGCRRPRPGLSASCFQVRRQQRFEAARGGWRREYKKLHERVRQQALSEELFDAWKGENSARSWTRFDQWILEHRN